MLENYCIRKIRRIWDIAEKWWKKTAKVTPREGIEYVSAFFNEIRLTIDKLCACILCVRYCSVDSCVWMTNTGFFFPAASDFPWKFVRVAVFFFLLNFSSFSCKLCSFASVWWFPLVGQVLFSSWKFRIASKWGMDFVAWFIQLFAYFYFKTVVVAFVLSRVLCNRIVNVFYFT